MAAGPAFDDAVAVARAHPSLGVGCHIVLTDGAPVSPPNSIRSLIGADGKNFRPSLVDFVRALFLGRINEEEVAREALAQIQKLQRAGIYPTHIDTHKHTHLFPSIARPLLQVADRCGIRAIRNPFEPDWSLALDHGSRARRLAVRLIGWLRPRFEAHAQLCDGRILTTDGTVAISATGQLNAATLGEILRALPLHWHLRALLPSRLQRRRARPRHYPPARPPRHRARGPAQRDSESPRQPNAPSLVHYGNLAE